MKSDRPEYMVEYFLESVDPTTQAHEYSLNFTFTDIKSAEMVEKELSKFHISVSRENNRVTVHPSYSKNYDSGFMYSKSFNNSYLLRFPSKENAEYFNEFFSKNFVPAKNTPEIILAGKNMSIKKDDFLKPEFSLLARYEKNQKLLGEYVFLVFAMKDFSKNSIFIPNEVILQMLNPDIFFDEMAVKFSLLTQTKPESDLNKIKCQMEFSENIWDNKFYIHLGCENASDAYMLSKRIETNSELKPILNGKEITISADLNPEDQNRLGITLENAGDFASYIEIENAKHETMPYQCMADELIFDTSFFHKRQNLEINLFDQSNTALNTSFPKEVYDLINQINSDISEKVTKNLGIGWESTFNDMKKSVVANIPMFSSVFANTKEEERIKDFKIEAVNAFTKIVEKGMKNGMSLQACYDTWLAKPIPKFRDGATIKDLICHTNREGNKVDTTATEKLLLDIINKYNPVSLEYINDAKILRSKFNEIINKYNPSQLYK